jgi:hypothetical protein
MDGFQYKYIGNAFSPREVLKKVEEHERDGWSLYSLDPTLFLILGSGGTSGMQAVMRRPLVRDAESHNTA